MSILCPTCGKEQPESEKCNICGRPFDGKEVKIKARAASPTGTDLRSVRPELSRALRDILIGGFCLTLALFIFHGIWKDNKSNEQMATVEGRSTPGDLWYIVGPNRVGCNSEASLDKAISYATAGDRAALWRLMYIEHACSPLTEGEAVYEESLKWSGKVKIRPQGKTEEIWTLVSAITDKPPHIEPSDVGPQVKGGMIETPRAGLGDTVADLEKAWNKGYRWSSNMCVRVGSSEESSIGYFPYMNFGDPPRVGEIDSGLRGMFGAAQGAPTTRDQFFSSIKNLMPKDSMLISAYKSTKYGLEEDYLFESAWLRDLPGARDAQAYSFNPIWKYQSAVGSFILRIHYDRSDPTRLSMFTLQIGTPPPSDIAAMGMTKIPVQSTPFRSKAKAEIEAPARNVVAVERKTRPSPTFILNK